jgi:hypothetical protein
MLVNHIFCTDTFVFILAQTCIFILMLSTLCILAVNHLFLLQLNSHNMTNTYIYHHLPPTCFRACYTISRETTALHAQTPYAFCNVVMYVVL